MKFFICAFAAAVTLLSLTTAAAVLPHSTYHLKDLVALRTKEARLESEDIADYYKYWDLFGLALSVTFTKQVHSFDLVHELVSSTQNFDSTVADEIGLKVAVVNDAVLSLAREYGANETPYDPMSEVGTKFHKFVAMEREVIVAAQRSILLLVKEEKPALVPRIQINFTLTDIAMTVAWTPTVAFLHQFPPKQ